jgi:hypothetical protein
MIAAKLRPLYDERAKRRQKGGRGGVLLEEKIPQSRKTQARDEAGKAAGVNGRYVDMARPSSP